MYNLFDFNSNGQQHIVTQDKNGFHVTPRRTTRGMRRSFDSVSGMTIIAVVLLSCTPEFVRSWPVTLANRWWIGQPVDVVKVRKNPLPGTYDALVVVNRQAGQWQSFCRLVNEQKRLKSAG